MSQILKYLSRQMHSVSSYILIILLVLILPLNMLLLNSASRSTNAMLDQVEYTLENFGSIYIQTLENRMNLSAAYLSEVVSENVYFQTVMYQKYDEQYKLCKFLLAQDMIDRSEQENEGDYYFLWSPALRDHLTVKRIGLSSSFRVPLEIWLEEHIEEIYSPEWQLMEIDGDSVLLRASCINELYIGIAIFLEPMADQLLNSIKYSSASVNFTTDTDLAPEASEDSLSVQIAVSQSNAKLCITVGREEALRGLTFLQRNAFRIACIYLSLIPLLLGLLNLFLLRPLRSIYKATTQIREGNSEYRFPDQTPRYYSVEFAEICVSFNQMIDSIQKLTIENYEYQLACQKVELENLQFTIRPHFLQNTFGMLFTLCQMGENKKLGKFILYLSDYFRYIYQSVNQLALFSSELSIIRGYIEVAHTQHPGSFEIHYELSEHYEDVLVPPLLIHNFIENIMSHALRRGTCVHILLKLSLRENMAVFEISDDGIGMSPDTVAAVNQGQSVKDPIQVHVGLSNSYHRLEKIYRGSASMRITSREGKGTTVMLHIPQRNKGGIP